MHGMLKYIDRRVARARRAFERLRPDKFKVYVSLGTVFNDKPEVFRMVLRALAAPDYQIIVCAGGMYEALAGNALPPNAALR